jgi:type IV secretion system protein VirB9
MLPFAAQAQTVPAIQPMPLVAAVDPSAGMGETPITITKQEREALNIAGKWIKHTGRPTPAGDGSVQYVFGSTVPTLICTPLQVCAVRFRAGEVINTLNVGDSARWKITRSSFGSGSSEVEVVVVKPTESGLVTNMIVTSNERIYTILLKAAKHEWMPFITFHYPEDEEKANAQHLAQRQRAIYSSTLSNGMNVANLDFGYKVSGDNVPWKPIRVYSDGIKTYIEFDSIGNEAPVFVELQSKGGVFSDPETKIVNNRFIGKKLVVDGIPNLSALIVGVGKDQRMVTIEKIGSAK